MVVAWSEDQSWVGLRRGHEAIETPAGGGGGVGYYNQSRICRNRSVGEFVPRPGRRVGTVEHAVSVPSSSAEIDRHTAVAHARIFDAKIVRRVVRAGAGRE